MNSPSSTHLFFLSSFLNNFLSAACLWIRATLHIWQKTIPSGLNKNNKKQHDALDTISSYEHRCLRIYLLERHGGSFKEEAEVKITAWPKASNTTTHGNILPPDLCTLRRSGGMLQGKDGSAGGKVWRGQHLRFPLHLVLPSFIYISSFFHLVHPDRVQKEKIKKQQQSNHNITFLNR